MTLTVSPLYLVLGVPTSAFLAVMVLVTAAIVTHKLRRRYKDAEWVPVAATVEQSGITRQGYGDGAIVFTPLIRYSYSYDGSQYESSTISPDLHYAGSKRQSDAQKWIVLFPVGTNVTAYIDKKNPDIAVLFPDFRYGWWYVLVMTFAVFGGCNFLLLIIMSSVA